jgi:hypothetical protein
MQLVHHINGWENFTVVKQDVPGIVVTTGGGLLTTGLANCMCLILTNGEGKYGMLHANPSHSSIRRWVESLRHETGATEAIVTGANGDKQSQARTDELADILNGLAVTDQTRTGWLPAALNATPGTYTTMAGCVAVNASNGDYAIHPYGFSPSVHPHPAQGRAGRSCADGGCTIL